MPEYDFPEHYADDVWSAIALAEALKESGEFDLFRGQRHTFDIAPSVFRNGVDRQDAADDLRSFAQWVHQTPDLASLHGNQDAIIAVAQHYGMKTPFLDFTYSPRIAGFFATDDGVNGDTGTIICLNRRRFMASWKDMNDRHRASSGVPLTDIVEIDVKNLWRLQAQKGAFLRCHVDPTMLEMFSYLLHIYFPQIPGPILLRNHEVYPPERSHLEVLLDQYFLIASYPERDRQMQEIFDHKIEVPHDGVESDIASLFLAARIPNTHASWCTDFAKEWYIEPDETYTGDSKGRRVELILPENEYSAQLEQDLQCAIMEAINEDAKAHRANIDWQIKFTDGSVVFIDGEGSVSRMKDEWTWFAMSEMVNVIYSGMRYLPYTNLQIARAITRYIVIAKFGAYKIIEKAEGVEFSGGGVRGRGFCSERGVLSALRDDFYNLIKPSKLDARGEMDFRDTLYAARFVKSSYVFERFVDLFVEDLLPTQAAVAVERLVVGVNPMRIDVLGES